MAGNMKSDKIDQLRNQILAGLPSLQQMHEFASRDFVMERIQREAKAFEQAKAAGVYPVQVGNFVLVDENTVRLKRYSPFAVTPRSGREGIDPGSEAPLPCPSGPQHGA
jgi:hypothetical protein